MERAVINHIRCILQSELYESSEGNDFCLLASFAQRKVIED